MEEKRHYHKYSLFVYLLIANGITWLGWLQFAVDALREHRKLRAHGIERQAVGPKGVTHGQPPAEW